MNPDNDAEIQQNEGEQADQQSTTLGIDPIAGTAENQANETADSEDPYGVKKRLGMQAKKHQRELRRMQDQIADLQSQLTNPNQTSYHSEPQNPFPSPGQPQVPGNMEDDRIRKAVTMALQAKDQEAQRQKQMEQQQHIAKQYQRLNDDLDKGSDKYDDFDDVVRGNDVPFTQHMRDALLLVSNPADVAYKLGKNRADLERISQLSPLDQAREVNKLSFALMGGNNGTQTTSSGSVLNNPRPNPASSSAVNANTPVSSIRAKMKQGTWK